MNQQPRQGEAGSHMAIAVKTQAGEALSLIRAGADLGNLQVVAPPLLGTMLSGVVRPE